MLAIAAATMLSLSAGAAARGHRGCAPVVVRVHGRTFVGDRYQAYQRAGCKTARLMTARFLRQGHSPTACENGCRVAYRWLCFYEGYRNRFGYDHDCFNYPQYPGVGFPVHPGVGFFFFERVR